MHNINLRPFFWTPAIFTCLELSTEGNVTREVALLYFMKKNPKSNYNLYQRILVESINWG